MFKKLREEAIIPQYQTSGSSGMDLHSAEHFVLAPNESSLISTGIAIEDCPLDPTDEITRIEFQIRSRSSIAVKQRVMILNGIGTIDWDYKGELMVPMVNFGFEDFVVNPGDRIAQLVIVPIIQLQEFVKNETRGEGGFGSTGTR